MTKDSNRSPFDHSGNFGSQGRGTYHNCSSKGRGSHGHDSQGYDNLVLGTQGHGCGPGSGSGGVSGSRPSVSSAMNGSQTMIGSVAASGSTAKSRPIRIHLPLVLVLHEIFESMFAEFMNEMTGMVEIPCLTVTRLSAIMATTVRSIRAEEKCIPQEKDISRRS
ncbi:hypothetical protein R1flu_027566 [Riccia fluitans]|uniref:Uncharacterized protein n=1 Tax=Riccia fluitans TaxID=41844 RepID=A0ABD1XJ58_9MARC